VNVSVGFAPNYIFNDHITFDGVNFSTAPPVPDSTDAAAVETGKVAASLVAASGIVSKSDYDKLWGGGDSTNTTYLCYTLDEALQQLQSLY